MMNFKTLTILTLALLIGLFAFSFYAEVSGLWYILIIQIWLTITAIGSFNMSFDFHLKAFTSNKKIKSKKIAITFDDGPHPEFTKKVLEILKRFNAKATFFCIGKNVESHPEIANKIVDFGHEVGNHSYSHSIFIDFNSTKKWLKEINNTDDAIEKVTGKKPTLFRPPFGVTTPHLSKAINKTGHLVVGWNNRPYDTAIKNKDIILNRIVKKVKPGNIILLHDTQPHILYVLEHLLLYLEQHNYQTVTVNELYNEN
ncbi:polysaccharide deacetylase family protein [Winogradskyella ursingii]|uniref:polysaccharide deacetylase family protein n=1 Tax=Winogradskyella ursingii TaxID=2686079 RepID=UPI0015C96459|nr:polysaccharide deacetylase family protein [Winogradskyella ursingii]